MDVLKGAINTIKNQKPNLIIENEIVHNQNPDEIFRFMSDIGYKIFYVNNKLQLVEKEESFDFKKIKLIHRIKITIIFKTSFLYMIINLLS